MEEPKVIIIILNWNRCRDTVECIESLRRLNYRNYEIILVDNNSSDDSVAVLSSKYPDMVLLVNKQNTGYTGGNNLALSYAERQGYDYVWLVNDDTVIESDCLNTLIKTAEADKKIGLVSPIVYYYEPRTAIQYCGSYVDWEKGSIVYPPERALNVDKRFLSGENVCLWGTALLIKRKVVKKIGYLRESLFAYWEDTEYSLRAIKAGFRTLVCAEARIYHKSTPLEQSPIRTSAYYQYYMTRNRFIIDREYLRGRNRVSLYSNYIAYCLEMYALCRHYNYQDGMDACLSGAWDALHGRFGAWDNTSRVPDGLRKFISSIKHPYLLADVIRADVQKITNHVGRRIRGIYKKTLLSD